MIRDGQGLKENSKEKFKGKTKELSATEKQSSRGQRSTGIS